MAETEQSFLETVTPGAKLRWSGTPNVGSTFLAELGCLGVPIIAFVVLGLVVAFSEKMLASPTGAHSMGAGMPPLWLLGLFGSFVLTAAILPGAVMELLTLRNTRYYITTRHVVIVDGIIGRRIRRFLIPPTLELSPTLARGGTIDFGSLDYEQVDAKGKVVLTEALPLRFRGLGDRANEVVDALRAARASES